MNVLRGIEVDARAHRVTVKGYVCLEDGILEFLAVVAGGREYESVLALKCKPSGLHTALILAGGKPGDLDPAFMEDIRVLPDGVKPAGRPGDRFNVTVRWQENGKAHEAPAYTFLLSRKTGRPPEPTPFVFTGSYFLKNEATGQEHYMADLDGGLIATFFDLGSILNMPVAEGNPYRGEQLGFALNKDVVPPKDTQVQVIFELIAGDSIRQLAE